MNSPASNRLTAGDRTVPWLNQLKDSWELRPLKYCCSINQRTLDDSTAPDTPISYIDISSVDSNGTVLETTALSFGDAPSRARRILATGDTFVSTVRTYLTAIGYCTPEIDGFICSTGFAVLSVFECVDTRFLYYWMRSTHVVDEIVARSVGVSYPAINASEVGNLPLPTIPLSEQRAIAGFLDRKTAQIDAVVAKKQRLIERLQEKRQALISHAVTKGLDPHAPMKDSGIEWLGEVPAHWNLKPLGSIVNIFGGSTPSKNNENYWTGGNIPWVSPKDMKRWEIDDSEDHITKDALVESGISLIRPPAILLVVRGMILARDVPVSITTVPVTINQDMKALVARPGCSAEFLGLLLRAVREAFFALIEESGHGTRCLRTELWRKLPLPIPPIEDQKAICAFVHSEVERATGIERRLVDQITKLQEYRQTLISAAVTGKLDVAQEAEEDARQAAKTPGEAAP